MGRTKVFNEQAALNQAMRLFWRQGYANTSVKELLAEMGMLNGSFYHCFKDKNTLFLKSLDYYNQIITYKRQDALSQHDDFSKGIRALFTEIFTVLECKDMPNGCLIVNSMTEEVLCIKELKDYLDKDFKLFVQFMTKKIQHSMDLNHTSSELSAKQLAFIIVTYIQGLFRVSNIYKDTGQLKSQTEHFLHSLGF